MEILSENQEYAISKFLQRYDYDAVLEILEEAGIIDGDLKSTLIEHCIRVTKKMDIDEKLLFDYEK